MKIERNRLLYWQKEEERREGGRENEPDTKEGGIRPVYNSPV